MGEIRSRRARPLRLTLGRIDADADGPGNGEDGDEDVNRDDDDPAAGSGVAVDGVSRVEAADQEHDGAEPEAAVDGTLSTAPFVGVDDGGDGDAEDDDG